MPRKRQRIGDTSVPINQDLVLIFSCQSVKTTVLSGRKAVLEHMEKRRNHRRVTKQLHFSQNDLRTVESAALVKRRRITTELKRWIKTNSWTYRRHCGMVIRNKMLQNLSKPVAPCVCTTDRYPVPTPEDYVYIGLDYHTLEDQDVLS